MPRAKYTKSPGPLPKAEHVRRAEFRFRDEQWLRLTRLLPPHLASLDAQADYKEEAEKLAHAPRRPLKTLADVIVHETEGAVNSHLTASPLLAERPVNPAHVRAAIRQLRIALKPFAQGWVDSETADLIPPEFDDTLARRERELESMRLLPAERRMLALLCQMIRILVTKFACANGATMSDPDVLRYIDFALTCGSIKHPDLSKHRDRLAALVFPQTLPASPLEGAFLPLKVGSGVRHPSRHVSTVYGGTTCSAGRLRMIIWSLWRSVFGKHPG
jgi:hypothetical protein